MRYQYIVIPVEEDHIVFDVFHQAVIHAFSTEAEAVEWLVKEFTGEDGELPTFYVVR